MEYRALKPFRDKVTGKRFKAGDIIVLKDKKRSDSALSRKIIEVVSKEAPEEGIKHVGGGWYELPNGERVKGKEEALKAGE